MSDDGWKQVLVVRVHTHGNRKVSKRQSALRERLEMREPRRRVDKDARFARAELVRAMNLANNCAKSGRRSMRVANITYQRVYKDALTAYRAQAIQIKHQLGCLRASTHIKEVQLKAELANDAVVDARYRRMMKVGMMKEDQARKHEVAMEQRHRLNESRRVSAMLMRHKYYNPQCPTAKAASLPAALSIPAVPRSTPRSPTANKNKRVAAAAVARVELVKDRREKAEVEQKARLAAKTAADMLTAAALRDGKAEATKSQNRERQTKFQHRQAEAARERAALAASIAAKLTAAAERKSKERFMTCSSRRGSLQPTCHTLSRSASEGGFVLV